MANKNLHDIKIDDLDSPKKTPLKNILTLLALLFIILVISIVITKLILNTNEGATIENNSSQIELLNPEAGTKNETNLENADSKDSDKAEDDKNTDASTIIPAIIDKNLTSVIKPALTTHKEPKQDIKDIKTYTTPKKNDAPKVVTSPKETTPTKHSTTPKKQYIDKVVIKKTAPKSTPATTTKSSSTQKISFLGGKQKAVSHSYYIKVGTYRNPSIIVKKIKQNNFNYSLVKVENDNTLTRVLVGPFFSRNQASQQLFKVKANILATAYITKAK